MSGKKTWSGYSENFLQENGAEVGSHVMMTEKGFMTKECWMKMTLNVIRGLRHLSYIRENPQWYVIEIFDGFGAHLNNLVALQLRHEAKILSIKEEGDTSAINQAYDKLVTRSDKSKRRKSLSFLCQLKPSNHFIYQWSLVHVGLAVVRKTKEMPQLWINSTLQ